MLVERLRKYLSCPEFNYSNLQSAFKLPQSFIARNNILVVHIWMINERLIEIGNMIQTELAQLSFKEKIMSSALRRRASNTKKVLQLIQSINEKTMEMIKSLTEKNLYRVKIHPTIRRRIKGICEKQAEQVTFLLYRNVMGKPDPDLLPIVQSIFFPHKRETRPYQQFTCQMAEYIRTHREYLKTLELEDFSACKVEWDTERMDKAKVKSQRTETPEALEDSFELSAEDLRIIQELEGEQALKSP